MMNQLINKKRLKQGEQKIFYNWIVNAQDVKLIFLSGTPVINKPSEIAILYNMLKVQLKFIHLQLKQIFYLMKQQKN